MTTVRTKKLSEFCGIATGGTPSREKLHRYFGGSIPWVKSGELEDGPINETEETLTDLGFQNSNARYFPKNTVLVALYGATVGKTAILEMKATTNQAVAGIAPDKDIADYKYIFYFLRSYAPKLMAARVGGAQPNISQGILRDINVPLPPLPIQKQIAAILEKADTAREKRRQANRLTEQFLQSAFLDMFGDPVTNPKGWSCEKVESLCDLVRGSSPRPKADPRFYGGAIPRLMIEDITRDGLFVTPAVDTLTEVGAKQSRWMKAGDVVMAVSGAIGLPAIIEVDACIHDGFVGFRNLSARVIPTFFLYHLLFVRSTNAIRAPGAIWKNLNTDQVKKWAIPLPPVRLQQRFLDLVEKVECLRAKQRESEKELENLFNSLMQRAFRGELVQSTA